jgi:hypothetical protein
MQSRKLIASSPLGPKAPRLVYQAFDDAWSEIVSDYSAEQTEATKTRLALPLLSVANDDSSDSRTLKRFGLSGGGRQLPLRCRYRPDPQSVYRCPLDHSAAPASLSGRQQVEQQARGVP